MRIMMGAFLEYNDAEAPVFKKYCDRIGGALKMPTGTRDDRHQLLEMLADSIFFLQSRNLSQIGQLVCLEQISTRIFELLVGRENDIRVERRRFEHRGYDKLVQLHDSC